MKRKIPIWLVISFISLVGIIVGCDTVYQQQNEFKFYEETYVGDVAYYNDIKLEITGRDNYFSQKFMIQGENGFVGNTEIIPFYQIRERNFASDFRINIGSLERIWEDSSLKPTGKHVYRVRDYYKNYPIEFTFWSEQQSLFTKNAVNDLLLIEVPDDASITITKESYNNVNSQSVSQNYNAYSIDLPYIKTDKGFYFTIPNLMLERQKDNGEIVSYQGISGILFLKFEDYVWEARIDNVIKVYAPIEIGSDLNVIVLDLVEASKAEDLSLAVLENQELYLYYYDGSTSSFLNKTLIGELPKEAEIQNFEIIKQDSYLLANYSYMDEKGEVHYASGVYIYLDEEEAFEVLLSKEYTSKLSENYPYIRDLAIDMYYKEGLLYLLHYETDLKFCLFALDRERILYAGVISTSLSEDYSIGDYPREGTAIANYSARYVEKVEFMEEE